MQTKTAIEIHAYWDQLRAHRDVPARSQIEPAHIRHILADLFILEKTGNGEFRFRLAGTRICALFARELRGSSFDSLWLARQTAQLAQIAQDVIAQKAPTLLMAKGHTSRTDEMAVEIVLLPLRSPAGAVDRIIGALVPLVRPEWIETDPVHFLHLEALHRIETPHMTASGDSTTAGGAPAMSGRAMSGPAMVGRAIRRVLHLGVLDGGKRP